MQGWGWQKVHHPDHVDRVVQRIRQSFETGGLTAEPGRSTGSNAAKGADGPEPPHEAPLAPYLHDPPCGQPRIRFVGSASNSADDGNADAARHEHPWLRGHTQAGFQA